MSLVLYNTLSGFKEPFEPANAERVTMYVCGNTVYNFAHIGNARPTVVFDVLFRLLKMDYSNVIYARNITDVDDKINASAREQNIDISIVTKKYIEAFHEDIAALNVQTPTLEPRATDHIPQIILMIEKLIDKGHAYAAEGHVLFHVPSYNAYGGLSGRDNDDIIAVARVEVAPYKKNPADFVLWKPSHDGLPGWNSPWGRGRPGWHIECSAMIETLLGDTIDIHGGGNDLIFPHHENEIAQGTCAHDGALYCTFWLHNGMLELATEKMSKSTGNVWLVRDLLERYPGEVVRLALLSAHYHQPLAWSEEILVQSKRTLDRFYGTLDRLGMVETLSGITLPKGFLAALYDDLNTPKALAELSAMAASANKAEDNLERSRLKSELLAAGSLLGLLQQDPKAWLQRKGQTTANEAEIEQLINARNIARAEKNFQEADRLRQELDQMGVSLEDGPKGTSWRLIG